MEKTRAFLGNLEYNQGADFNVVVCDASYDDLKSFDEWASQEENGGRSENGIGENIKNCFIVCAPQQKDDKIQFVEHTVKTTYTDFDGNGLYDEGSDADYNVQESTTMTPSNGYDRGDYDLVVTDHLGNLIRLTPPFADYDKRYFSVVNPTSEDQNSAYGARYITFNTKYQLLMDSTSTIVDTLSSTYTPILSYVEEVKDGAPSSRMTTVAYSFTDGKVTTYGTFTYDALSYIGEGANRIYTTQKEIVSDEMKEFLFTHYKNEYNGTGDDYRTWDDKDALKALHDKCTPHEVSFISLLQELDALRARCTQLENILRSNKITYVAPNSNVTPIGDRVTRIENSKILFRANSKMPAYLWAGAHADYDAFVKSNGTSYIFLHTMD